MSVIIRLPGGGADVNVVTANASEVLEGKIFVDANGEQTEGTMFNNGAVDIEIGVGKTITVPEGYHNGGGKITSPALDFITAGAEHIAKGYVGANANGEPITGAGGANIITVEAPQWETEFTPFGNDGRLTIRIPLASDVSVVCVIGRALGPSVTLGCWYDVTTGVVLAENSTAMESSCSFSSETGLFTYILIIHELTFEPEIMGTAFGIK